MNKVYKGFYKSAIGIIEIVAAENKITQLRFLESTPIGENGDHPVIIECKKQLREYFNGEREKFTLKVQIDGSDFQQRVLNELMTISFGKTVSYLEVAIALGDRNMVRAVGNANNRNKIPIIIPCHRVIGSSGDLVGYAGGLWRKKWLIDHEMEYSNVEKQMEIFK